MQGQDERRDGLLDRQQEDVGQEVRQGTGDHWKVENNLHWQRDVTFEEDANRVQQKTEALNPAFLRKTGIHLLKQDEGGPRRSLR